MESDGGGEAAHSPSTQAEGRAQGAGDVLSTNDEISDADYRIMLLQHWRYRTCGGNLREHDLGLSFNYKSAMRKKRKSSGLHHPMFKNPPPVFSHFEALPADQSYVEGGSEDEEEEVQGGQGASMHPGKRARNGKSLQRKENFSTLSGSQPFGDGPYSHERRNAWASVVRVMPHRQRDIAKALQQQQIDAKKCVQMCQKRYRKDALASLKVAREFASRCKKLSKEVGVIWRRENAQNLAASGKLDAAAIAQVEMSRTKKEAKEALERKKAEEAERERIRQQKRINFLLTQTELFAHFIGQKMGGIDTGTESKSSFDGPRSSVSSDGAPANDLAALDKAETKQALASAQLALQARQQSMQAFDEDRETKKLSRKSDQALVNSLDEAGLQHKDIAQTNEVARIFNGTLKPYQKIGFNWLIGLYEQGLNGILADEMGLGKTVQTISLLSWLAEEKSIWGPFLVVAPTSTMHNWYSELQKFCPQMKVIPYFGANPNERKLLRRLWTNPVSLGTPGAPFHVLVTNYKLIVADEKHFQRVKWQYMILDEAQAIKSSASQRWKILLGFNCRNRLLLTGTPIQNSMAELWALLHFIMPELFDSFSDFTEWFSKDIESSAEGKGTGMDQAQLRRLQLILQPFMLRRTKKDVLDELVHKVEIEVRTPLSSRQKYYYDMLKRRVTSTAELLDRKMLSKDDKRLHSLMNLVMQFRKVCNHPEIFERRDFISPLQFQEYVLPSQPPPPSEPIPVCVINRNPVIFFLPKLMYDDTFLHNSWSRRNCDSRSRLLKSILSPWSADSVHASMGWGACGPGLSCLRLMGLSPGEVSDIIWASDPQRWLAFRSFLGRVRSLQMSCMSDEDALKLPQERTSCRPNILFRLKDEDVEKNLEGDLVVSCTRRLHQLAPLIHVGNIFSPPVLSSPVQLHCVSAHCARHHMHSLESSWVRELLLGSVHPQHEPDISDPCSFPPLSCTLSSFTPSQPLLSHWLRRYGSCWIRVPDLARLITDAGKLRILDELLPKLKAEGHKVLMFCQMTKMMDILEDYFWYRKHTYLRLDGSASIADRRDMVNDFQSEDSDVFIFLLSTRAGGLGINLTAADTVVFYDSDWNPTMDAQAMDRAHRLGQTKQVTVYRLVSKNTIEERILHRAKQKDHIQQMVISGDKASSTFKGNVDNSFRATDFADLLFEEDADDDDDAVKKSKDKLKSESTQDVSEKMEIQQGEEKSEEAGGDASMEETPAPEGLEEVKTESDPAHDVSAQVKVEEPPEEPPARDEEVEAEKLGDWLQVHGKVEVEWGGEWWDGIVLGIKVNHFRKVAKVHVEYVGGEDDSEWIDLSFSTICGWISGRLREWEEHAEGAAGSAGAGAGAGGAGGAVNGSAGLAEKTESNKIHIKKEGNVEKFIKQQQEMRKQETSRSITGPAIIMDMED